MRTTFRFTRPAALALLAGGLLASLPSASVAAPTFTYTVVSRDGTGYNDPTNQFIVGGATFFNFMKVNNHGVWFSNIDTDGSPATNTLSVRNGTAIFQEGTQSDPNFPGVTLMLPANTGGGFNDGGDFSTNLTLSGTGITSANDTSIVVNGRIVLQEGANITDSFPQTSTWPMIGFFHTKMDNAGNVYFPVSTRENGISGNPLKRGFMKLVYDSGTNSFSQSIVARADQAVPGTTSVIADFNTGHEDWNVSSNGHHIFVCTYTPAFVHNGVSGNAAVYLDGQVVCKEGDEIPGTGGRHWRILDSSAVGVNANGDVVIRGTMDGDTANDGVIMKRVGGVWSIVAQEGVTTNPSLPGMVVNALTTEVSIDNAGNVMWPATWRTPPGTTTTATTVSWNDQIVLLQNVPSFQIEGQVVSTVRVITMGHQMNEAGTHAIARIVQPTNVDKLVLIGIEQPATQRCQPADIAADDGTPLPTDLGVHPNGGVNEGDYNSFFQGFFDAAANCDIANDDATPRPPFGAEGTNGGVNEGDYNCFFQKFFDGCPA